MMVNGQPLRFDSGIEARRFGTRTQLSTKKQALWIAELIEGLSPFIEEHTALLCPSCQKVCCINRHCFYTYSDALFISLLGEALPAMSSNYDPSAPCRFLKSSGCSLRRYLRPYRCTWFFCEPLLESIGNRSARYYRHFVNSLKRITLARQDFYETISSIHI